LEMSLKSKNARFALGQQIRVEYQPVEKPRGTQAAFSVLASSSVTAPDSSAPDDTPKT